LVVITTAVAVLIIFGLDCKVFIYN